MAALASTDTTIGAGGSVMAGGDSPNMRAKADTKREFARLHHRVLDELGVSVRSFPTDRMLQALVVLGAAHFDELVEAACDTEKR